MSEDDLKAVIASYQKKAFEMFNQIVVLETQVNSLNQKVLELVEENKKLTETKPTRKSKVDGEFN